MSDDRLFHRRLGHSVKVNALTAIEEIAWDTYILSADDFGVMTFDAVELQRTHDRMKALPAGDVQAMLERIVDVGLIVTFQHQGRPYCCQLDWQDYQKIRYAFRTIHPPIPAEILARCSRNTQWLHTVWPGGGRDAKLSNVEAPKGWKCPDWATYKRGLFRNGSGTGPERVRNGSGPRGRGRDARGFPVSNPVPVPVPNKIKSTGAARRPSRPGFQSSEPVVVMGVAGHVDLAPPPALVVSPTLRDCADGARGGADDRRRRVAGAHQGPARPIGFLQPGSAAPGHGGDGGGGTRVGEEAGTETYPEAGAVTAEADAAPPVQRDRSAGILDAPSTGGAASVDAGDPGLVAVLGGRELELEPSVDIGADPGVAPQPVAAGGSAPSPTAELLRATFARIAALPRPAKRRDLTPKAEDGQ